MEPLLLDSVWLKQNVYEDAEDEYQIRLTKRSSPARVQDQGPDNSTCSDDPLLLESVNFKQTEMEMAETLYQMNLAGTSPPAPAQTRRPANYVAMVDSVVADLTQQHWIIKNAYDGFQKQKAHNIMELRRSMQRLEDAVKKCTEEMEKNMDAYEKHEQEGYEFLQLLESTTQSVQQLRTASSRHPTEVAWKSIYKQLNNVHVHFTTMSHFGLFPHIKKGDFTRGVRNSIKNFGLVSIPKLLRKNMGKYPHMTSTLKTLVEAKFSSNGLPCDDLARYNNLNNAWKYEPNDDDGVTTDSLDGSLGDECLSDGWVSFSDIDLALSELNAGGGYSSSHSVRGGGDAPAVTNQQHQPVANKRGVKQHRMPQPSFLSAQKLSPKSATAEEASSSPKSSKVKIKKTKTASRRFDKQKCLVKVERHPQDAESLDGSLGSEEDSSQGVLARSHGDLAQGDLAACFATLQSESGNVARAKPKRQSSKSSTTSTIIFSDSSPFTTQSSESNSSPDKKFIPPPVPVTNAAESGGASKPSKNRKKKKNTPPDTSVKCSVYERNLKEMMYKMKAMLTLNGRNSELEQIFAEAELLLKMTFKQYDEEVFKHRLTLVETAFNDHLERRPKTPDDPKYATDSSEASPPKKPAKRKGKVKTGPRYCTLSISREVVKIASYNPSDSRDQHRAGVSCMVILQEIYRLVLVDIINGCLKLFDIHALFKNGETILLQTLHLEQPYYMTKFIHNQVLVSRAGKLITVARVTPERGFDLKQMIPCRAQYYGLAWVRDEIVACANYEANAVDVVQVCSGATSGTVQLLTSFKTYAQGPELLAVVPATEEIVYLRRIKGIQGDSVHVTGMDPDTGTVNFSIQLGGYETDVWNLSCVDNKIVCCNKMSNKIELLWLGEDPYDSTKQAMRKETLSMPQGIVNMPFAICFSGSRSKTNMHIANDAAWEEDSNHYVTTQINVFNFISQSSLSSPLSYPSSP